MTRNAFVFHNKAHQASRCSVFLLFQQKIFVNKIFFEGGDPGKPCLDGRSLFVDIVAVQAKTHFEPEGIAATQTTRQETVRCSTRHEGIPELGGLLGGNIELKTPCSGVTGRRDQDRTNSGHRGMGKMIVSQAGQINIAEGLQDLQGTRSLQGQQGGGIRHILHHHTAVGWSMAVEPFPVFAEVPRIDHQQIGFRGQVVNQQIVHQTTSTVGHAGILNPARKKRSHVVGGHLF